MILERLQMEYNIHFINANHEEERILPHYDINITGILYRNISGVNLYNALNKIKYIINTNNMCCRKSCNTMLV